MASIFPSTPARALSHASPARPTPPPFPDSPDSARSAANPSVGRSSSPLPLALSQAVAQLPHHPLELGALATDEQALELLGKLARHASSASSLLDFAAHVAQAPGTYPRALRALFDPMHAAYDGDPDPAPSLGSSPEHRLSGSSMATLETWRAQVHFADWLDVYHAPSATWCVGRGRARTTAEAPD
jgi:hypothetical protein